MSMFETLESRRLLSNGIHTATGTAVIEDGVLVITGTNHADIISIELVSRNGNTGNDLNVSVTIQAFAGKSDQSGPSTTTTYKFNGSQFSSIRVDGGQGNDTLNYCADELTGRHKTLTYTSIEDPEPTATC